MVETYDEFEAAQSAAGDGEAVAAVVIGGKPAYFTYAGEADGRAKAFEIKHGRPYGEPERAAKEVLDVLRPGWDQASLAQLTEALA